MDLNACHSPSLGEATTAGVHVIIQRVPHRALSPAIQNYGPTITTDFSHHQTLYAGIYSEYLFLEYTRSVQSVRQSPVRPFGVLLYSCFSLCARYAGHTLGFSCDFVVVVVVVVVCV